MSAPRPPSAGRSAWSRTGDRIRLDGPRGRLDLLVEDAELVRRRAEWTPPAPLPGADRGYHRLYLEQVTQAEEGCDFAFLRKNPFPGSVLGAK